MGDVVCVRARVTVLYSACMVVLLLLVFGLASVTHLNLYLLLTAATLTKLLTRVYSVQKYPLKDCTDCVQGRQYSSTESTAWRDCETCGGVGYFRRSGAREQSMGWARRRSRVSVAAVSSGDRLSRRADVVRNPVTS